jgi:stress response protein YsnF
VEVRKRYEVTEEIHITKKETVTHHKEKVTLKKEKVSVEREAAK